ncbi:hypothetical protein BOV94_12535 [Solemya velum gill symbiont]|uniref:hypothetical protein n=1 Tax=Solemya velum gill symbiont TaxID=2340 RepID=UPI0009973454|nr:hypothetical protein [Solemya velum gill symbiont]OOY49071.1 hypothetical protein BOV94_12535 [Solemya velum gill symbiont]
MQIKEVAKKLIGLIAAILVFFLYIYGFYLSANFVKDYLPYWVWHDWSTIAVIIAFIIFVGSTSFVGYGFALLFKATDGTKRFMKGQAESSLVFLTLIAVLVLVAAAFSFIHTMMS